MIQSPATIFPPFHDQGHQGWVQHFYSHGSNTLPGASAQWRIATGFAHPPRESLGKTARWGRDCDANLLSAGYLPGLSLPHWYTPNRGAGNNCSTVRKTVQGSASRLCWRISDKTATTVSSTAKKAHSPMVKLRFFRAADVCFLLKSYLGFPVDLLWRM